MKFKKQAERYLSARKALSAKYGPRELWSVVDQYPLYAGVGTLARNVVITELLRSTLSVPGHIAEFGCWRGSTTMLLLKLLRIWDPQGPKVLHAFDSFEGLTEFAPQDGDATDFAGKYKGSLEELRDLIELYEFEDDITIHQGIIEETLPKAVEADASLSFSFVYCDTDLYESTKLIVDLLHPRLMPGGVFVFDEWNYENYPGEGVAANEFLGEHASEYTVEGVQGAKQPSLVLRKR